MKYLIGLALFLFAVDTFAWEADNSKSLADLLYIPNTGRFYGETSINWESLAGEIDTGTGDVDYKRGTNTFAQKLGYGINDRIQVFAKYSNQLKGRTSIEANGNSDEEGPYNPEVGALYRLLKQEDDSITLDLLAGYAPDLFDSESNSTKDESDAASGGSALFIGGRAGKKFTNLEMMGEVTITINGSRESKDTVTKEKTKADGNAETHLAYIVQVPLENGFWLRGKLISNAQGELKVKFTDGTTAKRDPFTSSELNGSLVYMAVEDHLVLEAGMGVGGVSEYKIKFSDGTRNKYKDTAGNRVFLSALYQF